MSNYRLATFAAGRFWGVEAKFAALPGVVSTRVGYAGGHTKNPSYEAVSGGQTGHAEAVEVIYEPSQITYQDLLLAFWNMHDPTQVDQQGTDVGSQYRSMIFYHDQTQFQLANEIKQKLEASGRFKQPIVTEITPSRDFYPAEEYHQKYLEKQDHNNAMPYSDAEAEAHMTLSDSSIAPPAKSRSSIFQVFILGVLALAAVMLALSSFLFFLYREGMPFDFYLSVFLSALIALVVPTIISFFLRKGLGWNSAKQTVSLFLSTTVVIALFFGIQSI